MPSLDSWIEDPLGIIQNIYETYHGSESWEKEATDFFVTRLSVRDNLTQIPSLNEIPLSKLKTGQLVRFRAMVQDQLGTEFYCSEFILRNPAAGMEQRICGKYRDEFSWKQDEEVVNKDATSDRQLYYCVPIPGETSWVKEVHRTTIRHSSSGISSRVQSLKRGFSDEEDMDCAQEASPSVSTDVNKRVRTEDSTPPPENTCHRDKLLNLPLPSSDDVGCIVKVYSEEQILPMNEVVEIVGIVSMESPVVQQASDEFNGFNPPSSLIPRLHCIDIRQWQHNNPRLPQTIQQHGLSDVPAIRDSVHAVLTRALSGDALAADYLLCHLISNVYLRKDVMALGKFSLNLTNFTENSGRVLYSMLEQLVTKAHYLPLTLENLNKSKFIPSKDYNENRLVSGMLQLSPHTHLVLDETAMSTGQLDPQGVRNVAALGNIITWQKVSYDFSFHEAEFSTNIPVLILSERKSLLPSDVQIPLQTAADPQRLQDISQALQQDSSVEDMRNYLTVVRLMTYELNPEIQNVIQEDFVRNRQATVAEKMTAEDLHHLLVLARLVALTYGQNTLTLPLWEKAKAMESERKARIARR